VERVSWTRAQTVAAARYRSAGADAEPVSAEPAGALRIEATWNSGVSPFAGVKAGSLAPIGAALTGSGAIRKIVPAAEARVGVQDLVWATGGHTCVAAQLSPVRAGAGAAGAGPVNRAGTARASAAIRAARLAGAAGNADAIAVLTDLITGAAAARPGAAVRTAWLDRHAGRGARARRVWPSLGTSCASSCS
jgi:hypothetical protein